MVRTNLQLKSKITQLEKPAGDEITAF